MNSVAVVGLSIGWLLFHLLRVLLEAQYFGKKTVLKPFEWGIYLAFCLILSVGLLTLSAWFSNGVRWFEKTDMIQFASFVPTTFGILILNRSLKSKGLKSFVLSEQNPVKANAKNIYQFIRNPNELALVLILIGFFVYAPNAFSLIAFVANTLGLMLGITWKEKRLQKQIGDKYKIYQSKTPFIFPKTPRFL